MAAIAAPKRPLWAVVPCKSAARGKSRLRPLLADEERVRFARDLLTHTLDVLVACERIDGILIATDGNDVAEIGMARGASVRRDDGEGTLASVVDSALASVAARGAAAAIVLMADLPLLDVDDLRELAAALDGCDVVVARDHLGRHTNALGLAPPLAMRTSFGQADSFAAHCGAARAASLRLRIVESEHIAFDVDDPGDLARLSGRRPRGET